jgi:acetyl-CoA C-acetyltransferase
MRDALIIDACRTPRGIGKLGKGALSGLHPQHVAATVLRALVERNEFDTADVDDIIWGTSAQVCQQSGDLARMAALDAGSGLTSANLAAAAVMSGMEDLVISGGTEMMSMPKKGVMRMGSGNARLEAKHPQSNQGVCADAIASMEGIGREDLDALAVESQTRAATALREGRFDRSVVAVVDDDGAVVLDKDEYPRPGTTMETLAALTLSFAEIADHRRDESTPTYRELINRKYPDLVINHFHHAGNSSGVVDGAAAILWASPEYASAHGLRPRARLVAATTAGDCPTLMLNAPVAAARKVLDRAGLSVDDIDLFEVNEAFAVVPEKFQRDLGLDKDRINVNGGAIALGHPIGATGAILIGTLLDELERRDARYGLAAMCTGGGMAPAAIIERL